MWSKFQEATGLVTLTGEIHNGKKDVLKSFLKFTGRKMSSPESLFNKVRDWKPTNLLKQRLLHKCFLVTLFDCISNWINSLVSGVPWKATYTLTNFKVKPATAPTPRECKKVYAWQLDLQFTIRQSFTSSNMPCLKVKQKISLVLKHTFDLWCFKLVQCLIQK